MNLRTIIALLIFCFIGTLNVNAQSTTKVIEDVILFKSKPHMVRMTPKGKILAFVKAVDNNYSALNNGKSNSLEMDETQVIASIDLARQGGNTMDPEELRSLRESNIRQMKEAKMAMAGHQDDLGGTIAIAKASSDEDMTAKGSEIMAKGSEEKVSGPKRTNYDYEFAFNHRDASLSTSSLNQINQISKILKDNKESAIEIRSYYSDSVDVSKLLSKNRTQAIHDMLVSKGIPSSKISILETNNTEWDNNRVNVSVK